LRVKPAAIGERTRFIEQTYSTDAGKRDTIPST
jgi:hypothetical protein